MSRRSRERVVIVGGGPGGAAAAMFLAREGIQAHIVESEPFPRYHIGESLTGAGGKVLRELGLEEEMDRRGYPRKQGVNVYGQSAQGRFWVPVTGRDDDWNLFPWHTWQVRRSDFDDMLLQEAVRRGATLQRARATAPLQADDGAIVGVRVREPDGTLMDIDAELVLDCSGQATFLANAGVTGPKYVGSYDKQIAIFSQVRGTARDPGDSRQTDPDNTLIFYKQKFHWAWFIPLSADVVSVGVVIPSSYFMEKRETPSQFLHRELHELHPELMRRVPDRTFAEDVHVIPNYSYQVRRFCGRGYVCIGDAHRFIDPIFSFGLTVSLREAQMVAPLVAEVLRGGRRERANPFDDHQLRVEQGLDVLEDAIDLFWERPLSFAFSVHRRHVEHMTDLFAGRIFEHQPSQPVLEFRDMLGRTRGAEYDTDDSYSVPVGSRYHPERAGIWQTNAAVESTEHWMGPR